MNSFESTSTLNTSTTNQFLPTVASDNKKLSNGLTYQVKKNNAPKGKVRIEFVVKVGSINELEHQQGFAHFIEHMAFLGTKSYPANVIKELLHEDGVTWGADHNASTGHVNTKYYLNVPSGNIEKYLHMTYEMIFKMTIASEQVEKEKTVILDEKRRTVKWKDDFFCQKNSLLYPGLNFENRPPIGTEKCIEDATAEKLREFYNTWYTRPDLMGLFVVGDIDEQSVETDIERIFGSYKKSNEETPPSFSPIALACVEQRIAIIRDKEISKPQIEIITHPYVGKMNDPLVLKQKVEEELLKSLIHDRVQMAYEKAEIHFTQHGPSSTWSKIPEYREVTYGLVADDDNFLLALPIYLKEIRRLQLHGISEQELQRSKTQYSERCSDEIGAVKHYDHITVAGQLTLGFIEPSLVKLAEYCTEAKRIIPEINGKDIADKVNKLVINDTSLIFVLLPEGCEKVTEQAIKEKISEVNSLEVDKLPDIEHVDIKPLPSDFGVPGKIVSYHEFESVGLQKVTLDNGIEVYLKPINTDGNLVFLRGYSRAPKLLEGQEKHELLLGLEAVNLVGFSGYDTDTLKNSLAGINTDYLSLKYSKGELSNSSLTVSEEKMEWLFKLAHLKLRDHNYLYEDEFARQFSNVFRREEDKLKRKERSDLETMWEIIDRELTNDHEYYRSMSMDELQKVSLEGSQKLLARHLSTPANWRFIVTGNFTDMEKTKGFIEKYLGSLKSKEDVARDPVWQFAKELTPPEIESKKDFFVINDNTKAHIISYCGATTWKSYDSPKQHIIDEIAKSIVQKQLLDILRGEKGKLYTIAVSEINYMTQKDRLKEEYLSYQFIYFQSVPEQEKVEAILREVRGIIGNLITDKEKISQIIKGEIENKKLKHRTEIQTNSYWSEYLINSLKFPGKQIERMKRYVALLEEVTVEEIQAGIKKLFNPKSAHLDLCFYPKSLKPKE